MTNKDVKDAYLSLAVHESSRRRCGSRRCEVCNYLVGLRDHFLSSQTGRRSIPLVTAQLKQRGLPANLQKNVHYSMLDLL